MEVKETLLLPSRHPQRPNSNNFAPIEGKETQCTAF
jgi:hypothetical protein